MLATYKRYRDVPTQLHLFFERAYNTLLSEHDFLKTGFRRRFYTSIDSMYYAQYFSEFCARSYDAKIKKADQIEQCFAHFFFVKHIYTSSLTKFSFRSSIRKPGAPPRCNSTWRMAAHESFSRIRGWRSVLSSADIDLCDRSTAWGPHCARSGRRENDLHL